MCLLLVTTAGQALAEERPAVLTPDERESAASAYLQEKLATWQKRLQLHDWRISIELSHAERLRTATLGNIRWDPEKKAATIRVLHPSQYKKPFKVALEDMEFTLVHELIHLTLSSLPRSDANAREEEHAINQIANALLQRTPVE